MAESVVGLFAESGSTIACDDGSQIATTELVAEGCQVAAWLGERGVRPGDRVAIRMANGASYVRTLIGCAAAGAVAVSVNTRYSDPEADDLVRRSGAGLVIDGVDDDWRGCRPMTPVGDPDDHVVVFTTSGTTSRPKMVVHRQRSIAAHAGDVARAFGYDADAVVMVAMPLCGTFGLASLTSAVAGGSRVVLTDFDVVRTARLVAEEGVTHVNGSDDMFHRLLDHGADVSSIRLGGYARFNSSLDGIVGRAEAAGATLTGLYGMSEVQALYSLRHPGGSAVERSRPGGTLVSPLAEYRVLEGELQLRGPSLFAGYLAEGGERVDADLTARNHDDGWFRTGDLAEPDDERTFEYLARMGDALRLGGFLVSPAEIEAVLQQLDVVDAAQVVAVERPGGARPVAFVLTRDGAAVDERAAIEHCRGRLARYKVPVRVIVLEAFPTTPSANGTKIRKAELREMAAAALDG